MEIDSLKTKISKRRDDFISFLKQLKKEIDEIDTLLLVEGKNDKAFFEYFGFNGDKIIEISYLSEEKILIKLKTVIKGDYVVCIPLVDFDSEGIKYLKRISKLDSIKAGRSQYFKKLRVDTFFRHKLSSLLIGKYREIEDLIYYVDKMQILPEDIK